MGGDTVQQAQQFLESIFGEKNTYNVFYINSHGNTSFHEQTYELKLSSITILSKDQFKNRLEIAKNKIFKKSNISKESSSSNLGIAFKMSTELVAAVVVGTIIGFILDNWFGTKPWLILIFFFVGVVAGILNVFRSAKSIQNK